MNAIIGILGSIKGYRTLIANGAALVIAALVALGVLPAAEFVGVTPEVVGAEFDKVSGSVDTAIAAILALGGIVGGYLRIITKGPVGAK